MACLPAQMPLFTPHWSTHANTFLGAQWDFSANLRTTLSTFMLDGYKGDETAGV